MSSDGICMLLIEDNDLDAERIERNLRKMKSANSLHRARHGLEALDMLARREPASVTGQDCVVWLDLNMPRMNGLEFLGELRSHQAYKDTPVFVLTTSDHLGDIDAARQFGIAGYFVKPVTTEIMAEAFASIRTLRAQRAGLRGGAK